MSPSSLNDVTTEPVIAFTIEELTVGGAERMVAAMANEFLRQGWRVHLVCLRQAGVLAADLDEGVNVHVLNKQPGVDLPLLWRLNRCLRKIRPNVINSHLWVANTWTRLAMLATLTPIVATEHSRDIWKPTYYRWIDRLLANRTAALVSVSGDTAAFYRDTVGLKDSLVTVINNGVDTLRYAQGDGRALRKEWLMLPSAVERQTEKLSDEQSVLIGTVGRIVEAKNHRRLIDAMDMLCKEPSMAAFDLRLVLVGDGEGRQDIEEYVAEKGLKNAVIFTGARHDIPDVLAAFDVFVLSSDREGHPLTALEAQAAGTPVVLTDAGGSCEAIARHEAQSGGVLVEKSADALACALREMILYPQLRTERGVFARHYALSHFDQKHMVQRYAELFKQVAKLPA